MFLMKEADLELPFEVATVGVISVFKKHDDGTSFVLLQGLERVRSIRLSKNVHIPKLMSRFGPRMSIPVPLNFVRNCQLN